MDTSIIYSTVKELAEQAGVTQRKVRDHVNDGLLDSTLGLKTGMKYTHRNKEVGLTVRQNKCNRLLFTPDQVEAYVDLMKNSPEGDGRAHPKPRVVRKGSRHEKGYSCNLAGKFCGVSGATIRSAVKAGFIKSLNVNPIKIREEELRAYKAALKDRMSLMDASKILLITLPGVRSMAESGRLEQVFKHMVNVYVSRKAVNKMAEKYQETHRAGNPRIRAKRENILREAYRTADQPVKAGLIKFAGELNDH